MEKARLAESKENNVPWKKWGPYLSERQWGTVREDYSETGDAWNYLTHDQGHTAGEKTGWLVFQMISSYCASHFHYGTGMTRSLKRGFSG
jgi:hypothetical protein